MKFVQLLALMVLVWGTVACGQKGPLVMPDAQKHKRTVPTLPGAPAKPSSTSPASPAPAPAPAPAPSAPPADSTHP